MIKEKVIGTRFNNSKFLCFTATLEKRIYINFKTIINPKILKLFFIFSSLKNSCDNKKVTTKKPKQTILKGRTNR